MRRLPFEFRGEIPAEPSYDELAVLEAAARRGVKFASSAELRRRARDRQQEAGIRIRIHRAVTNQHDFKDELSLWHQPVNARTATRTTYGKGAGGLAITLFDTKQQHLLSLDDSWTEEALCERLARSRPELFKPTGHIAVAGTALFGNMERPFIGLTLAPPSASLLLEDRSIARRAVAPELTLRDDYVADHRLHVSLGQVFLAEEAPLLQQRLEPVIPKYIQFGAAASSRID